MLRDARVTSVLIGASRPAQLDDSLRCLEGLGVNEAELAQIEEVLR